MKMVMMVPVMIVTVIMFFYGDADYDDGCDGDENLMPRPECVAWSGVGLSSRSGRCYANDTFRVLILKVLSIS